MDATKICVCVVILIMKFFPGDCIFLVIPEDVPAGFATIYGFSPRLKLGKDHRIGFGFRFGNHADFQLLYELGPQLITRPLQPIRGPISSAYRQRIVRRRPIVEFLFRAGIIKESAYNFDVVHDVDVIDEPR